MQSLRAVVDYLNELAERLGDMDQTWDAKNFYHLDDGIHWGGILTELGTGIELGYTVSSGYGDVFPHRDKKHNYDEDPISYRFEQSKISLEDVVAGIKKFVKDEGAALLAIALSRKTGEAQLLDVAETIAAALGTDTTMTDQFHHFISAPKDSRIGLSVGLNAGEDPTIILRPTSLARTLLIVDAMKQANEELPWRDDEDEHGGSMHLERMLRAMLRQTVEEISDKFYFMRKDNEKVEPTDLEAVMAHATHVSLLIKEASEMLQLLLRKATARQSGDLPVSSEMTVRFSLNMDPSEH